MKRGRDAAGRLGNGVVKKRAKAGGEGGRRERYGKLPVQEARGDIMRAFARANVLILVGDTGSGKTTQVPQMILDSGRDLRDRVVTVTQPRRVAAMSVAARVASERGCTLGEEVSYAVRFDDCTTRQTRLRYVTDGVLLREALEDRLLSRYAVIVIDEVHERSINTDVLVGIAKRATQMRRSDLKLVVMSATADAIKLKNFFGRKLNVEVLKVPGRLHRVELMYTVEPLHDYLDGAVTAALQVHVDEALPGDILVFLSGQEEIDAAISILHDRVRKLRGQHVEVPKLLVLPLYAALPPNEQLRAIEALPGEHRNTTRKVLFATNVAETSITIRNVKYVVDAGVAKSRNINLRTGADTLRVCPISRAQARQRGGRAGRDQPGKCFRLYTEEDYFKMSEYPTPEILRCDLASAVLHLIAMGISNPLQFDFIDPPPRRAVANALEILYSLGALDENMELTVLGREMSLLPLTPMLARAVLEAKSLGCLAQMLTLASMLSVESPFLSPRGKREQAEAARLRFSSQFGDHLSLYNAFRSYLRTEPIDRGVFCRDYFLNGRAMSSAVNVRDQLEEVLGGKGVVGPEEGEMERELLDSLRKSVVAGYFRNAARLRSEDQKYVTLGGGEGHRGGVEVSIHPSSALRNVRKKPPTIIYNEMVITTRSYVRTVLDVDRVWLVELSRNYYRME